MNWIRRNEVDRLLGSLDYINIAFVYQKTRQKCLNICVIKRENRRLTSFEGGYPCSIIWRILINGYPINRKMGPKLWINGYPINRKWINGYPINTLFGPKIINGYPINRRNLEILPDLHFCVIWKFWINGYPINSLFGVFLGYFDQFAAKNPLFTPFSLI